MRIKIHTAAKDVRKALFYNTSKLNEELGTRIVCVENVSEEFDIAAKVDLIQQKFKALDRANIRTINTSFHVSINPSIDEQGMFDVEKVTTEYMKYMGYSGQPYIVFEHNDSGRTHYHIVSHRVQSNGKKIKDSNEIYRSHKFEVDLEQRLCKVKKVASEKDQAPLFFNLKDGNVYNQIREIVGSSCSYQYSSLYELLIICFNRKIGVSKSDNYLLAAGYDQFGERKTRAIKINEKLVKAVPNKIIGFSAKERMINMLRTSLDYSTSERHAINILARKGIGIHFLKKEDGTIYGVYYIDHKNKFIVKGSELRKDLSATSWEKLRLERWEKEAQRWKNVQPVYRNGRIGEVVDNIYYACIDIWGYLLYNPYENYDETYNDLRYSAKRKRKIKK